MTAEDKLRLCDSVFDGELSERGDCARQLIGWSLIAEGNTCAGPEQEARDRQSLACRAEDRCPHTRVTDAVSLHAIPH